MSRFRAEKGKRELEVIHTTDVSRSFAAWMRRKPIESAEMGVIVHRILMQLVSVMSVVHK